MDGCQNKIEHTMSQGYILDWLDTLITVSFNPSKTDLHTIETTQILNSKARINEEMTRTQVYLKTIVFSLESKNKIDLFVNRFYSALLFLLDQAIENSVKCPDGVGEIKQLNNEIISSVDELLVFMAAYFGDYLNLNQRIPPNHCKVGIKRLTQQLDSLRTAWEGIVFGDNFDMVESVMRILYSCIGWYENKHTLTFTEVVYLKELCGQLNELSLAESEMDMYNPLDRVLIYLNFNSKHYLANLTARITEKVKNLLDPQEKTEQLLLFFKDFKQLPIKPDVVFDRKHQTVDVVITNWFAEEIFYLEKKCQSANTHTNQELGKSSINNTTKIICNLSVDQIAIVLRSMDDLKIFTARSLSAVFKTIVPYLSTPERETISYDSMRSKSYAVEERDKAVAIQTLEKMIKRIKEY